MMKFRSKNIILLKELHRKSYSTADYIDVSFAEKYDSRSVEQGKYDRWMSSNYFSPKTGNDEKQCDYFTMILPPPNITGTLHLGHALTITIQDILCRWKRMQNIEVLWIPGTDHAGIATHAVVGKNIIKKKGLRPLEVKGDGFLEEISKWKKDKEMIIKNQIKRLGASVDWSRYTFTMDGKQSEVVHQSVIKLFDDGLLHKKQAFVNWCCHLQSTISDIEVENVRIEKPTQLSLPSYENPVEFGFMIEFAYKIFDSGSISFLQITNHDNSILKVMLVVNPLEDEICVATTRLETMLGDVAIIINPNDTRYTHLHGKFAWHPFRKCKLPIILDEFADPKLGTGAFKLTPAHSKIDYEIAMRHNLPIIPVIAQSGQLNENCGEWESIPRYSARDSILKRLQEMGLYRSKLPHSTSLPICSRSGDVIEHVLKDQWFLKCHTLSQESISVLEKENFSVKPNNMKNVIINWLQSDQDWCLSRQISWGHKFPLFETEYGWIAAKSEEEVQQKAQKKFSQSCSRIVQEKDVIDTWFSSALLPFSVFGWPEINNKDYKTHYPLSLMETGRDIACLWVARMIMLGIYFTKQPPFNHIIFHGLICDSYGRKMSKSLGNVIELDHVTDGISLKELNKVVNTNYENGILSEEEYKKALSIQKSLFSNGIPECGADALRFTLVSHDFKEPIINFDVGECRKVTNFCNKIWQAFRYSITWANKFSIDVVSSPMPLFSWHFWILHKLASTVEICNESIEETNFHNATSALKHFFVHDLCDFYLEASKPVFRDGSQNEANATISVLLFCLETYLKLLAPIMPFITEELYSYLPGNSIPITSTSYPKTENFKKWKNDKLEREILFIRNIISNIRALQAEIKNFTDNEVIIISDNEEIIQKYQNVIEKMLKCTIDFQSMDSIQEPSIATIQGKTIIHLKLKTELENLSSYTALLESKKKKLLKKFNDLQSKISTKKYAVKTSEDTKRYHKDVLKKYQDEIKTIEELKLKICKII